MCLAKPDFETFSPLPRRGLFSYTDGEVIGTELGIKLNYVLGQKKIIGHRKERKFKGSLPVFELKFTTGISRL